MIQNNIETILIETNQSCNFSCKYCFYHDFQNSKKILSLEDIKLLIKKYKNLKEVYITGGEPTLNNDLRNIINFLSNHFKVNLFTNGSLIDKTIDGDFLLDKLKYLFISVDSFISTEESYREMPRDFTINILRLIRKNPNKVCLKVTLTNQNIDIFENFITYFKEKGCKNFSINFAHDLNSSNIKFKVNELKKIKNVFNIIEKNKSLFLFPTYLANLKKFMLYGEEIINSCKAGKSFRFIDCEKNDVICPDNQSKDLNLVNKKKCFSPSCIALWEFY